MSGRNADARMRAAGHAARMPSVPTRGSSVSSARAMPSTARSMTSAARAMTSATAGAACEHGIRAREESETEQQCDRLVHPAHGFSESWFMESLTPTRPATLIFYTSLHPPG